MKFQRFFCRACVLVGLAAVAACSAQRSEAPVAPATTTQAVPARPLHVQDSLYEAEFLMNHQSLLTPAQITSMQTQMNATQQEIVALEWRLRAQTEALTRTLQVAPIDEEAAVHATAEVAAIEGQIKQSHLRLLVRLKNQLTEAQRSSLDQLRSRAR